MFGRFGFWEILVIVLLVVVLFGSAKIPSMMRNLAGGIKTFKQEMKDSDDKPAQKKRAAKKPAKKVVAKKSRSVKK